MKHTKLVEFAFYTGALISGLAGSSANIILMFIAVGLMWKVASEINQ